MYRVLVVEDNTEYYERELLRFFDKLLPMSELKVHRAATLEEAVSMVAEPWNIILVDYFLGAPAPELPEEPGGKKVKHGADFISLRRRVEAGGEMPPSTIIGISNVQIGNATMVKAGADTSYNKGLIQEIAGEVGRGLETHA